MNPEVDLVIPEACAPLWQGGYEHYALYGGRGGAKSHGIAEPIVAQACQREERVVCARQFQVSIKDSVKELLEKKIKKMNMAAFFNVTEREIVNISTGSRFSFIGMDRNPDSAKSLEGCTLFWGEEAHTFTNKSIEIIIPTIRDIRSRLYWSWNPRFRDDPVDAMFRGPEPPENSYIKEVSWRDNPFFYQTRMPSEMRRMKRANPKRYHHVWEGGYDENPDSVIFDNWEIGQVDIPDKLLPRFGMDFGFSSDPNVAIKLYVIEDLDVIYITHEAIGYRVPNKKLPALLDTIPGIRDHEIIADSARPETIEYLDSEGYNIYPSRKGAGSIKNGINWLLGYKIVVHPRCATVVEELRNYKWKLDANDKPLPVPAERQQDHCIDAIRYAVEEISLQTDRITGEDVVFI